MSMPSTHVTPGPVAEFIDKHEPLRAIRHWLTELLGEKDEGDTSIAWEDGEDHDEDAPGV